MTQVREDVLNGWKEIAAYLGRDPRTVERWEKSRSLPVRRLPGAGRATVYAFKHELDAWLASPAREAPQARGPDQKVDDRESSAREVAGGSEDSPQVGQQTQALETGVVRGARWQLVLVSSAALIVLVLCFGILRRFWAHRRSENTAAFTHNSRSTVQTSPAPDVEELYLRATYEVELRTADSLRHAQDTFSAALQKDPKYAPALAGLACTFVLLREYSAAPEADAYQRAEAAAQRALVLNPDLAQAHAVLGFVDFFYHWDPRAGEEQFKIASRLTPDLALAHHWYGSMLTHQGRYPEALRELDLAQKLEPGSSAILTIRALALGLSGRRQEASDLLADALSSEHNRADHASATMHGVSATLSLLRPRDIPRYIAEETLAATLREDSQTVADLNVADRAYRKSGEHAMWQALLDREEQRSGHATPTYALARYEAEQGERNEALDTLATLFHQHNLALIGLEVDPLFSPLRSNPRFVQLVSSVGLQVSGAVTLQAQKAATSGPN